MGPTAVGLHRSAAATVQNMSSEEHIRSVIESYAAAHSRSDADAIGELFAVDAVVTDPVDQPSHVGRDDIVKFFSMTHRIGDGLDLRITGPIRAVGNFGAVPLQAVSTVGEDRFVVDVIDVFTFDDDGLITDMKAYWSSRDVRPL